MKATRNANIDEYRRRAREARPVGTQRETGLYRKYHLTIEGWDELLARQGGGCAVCGAKPAQEPHNRNPTATRASLHVDHDHACCPGPYSCGRCVRGLLCSRCNRAVGLMADNPERLRAAADYVERSRSDAVPI